MEKKLYCFLLALILCLAFLLRFYQVTQVPPSLNWDEVSIGYNAYSILKTGKDEWNVFLPIHFKAYGEYKLPAQIYASIPGITIFGLNELGVRITPVIYGTLTVLLLFFLTRAIFQNNFIALGASFLLAISPWHIQFTRASFESSFAVLWVVLGTWFLVKGFKNIRWFIYSTIPLAISIYTYNSARVFIPLYILVILIIYRKTFLKIPRILFISFITLMILLLPLIPYYFSGEGNARYKLVSITDDPGLIPRINQNRGNANLPDPLPRLMHNKVTYVSFYVIQNYLAHFTPDFLFISGAPHKQHHVQGMGELYWFQAPFLLIGLYFLFKRRQQFRWLQISWLLVAFIPVSITNDSIPHALRTLIAVPTYQIFTALGFYEAYQLVRSKKIWNWIFIIIASLTISVSIFLYLRNYYQNYAKNYSQDWQYGYKQVVEFIKQHYEEYDQIIFSRHFGEPHMFTLFFLNYDPSRYQNDQNLVRYESYNWVWVLKFDKFYFPDLGDKSTKFEDIVTQVPDKKLLFIGKSDDFPKEWQRLKTISFLDGQPAFDIIEKK
ncbi:MAG: glycosyltransferase family 39 protein [Candidatus Daviesbacteria bacterium]